MDSLAPIAALIADETEEQAMSRLNALDHPALHRHLAALRRTAERQGLRFSKSKMRDPRGLDYLGYRITDSRGKLVIERDAHGYLPSLVTVEKYLLRRER
jgi:hypothetical protein